MKWTSSCIQQCPCILKLLHCIKLAHLEKKDEKEIGLFSEELDIRQKELYMNSREQDYLTARLMGSHSVLHYSGFEL